MLDFGFFLNIKSKALKKTERFTFKQNVNII